MAILKTLGIVSCLGGPARQCGFASEYLRNDFSRQEFDYSGLQLQWNMLYPEHKGSKDYKLFQLNKSASRFTEQWVKARDPFLVVGGDHSCALGTWSGALKALKDPNQFGLIWLDAHMDAHTFRTSPSGNSHGMPVAALLGQADTRLANLYPATVFLNPENLVLIGVRSYEKEEYALLDRLNVRVVFSNQLFNGKGLSWELLRAIDKLSQTCQTIGISIDLDVLDPGEAPGVETPAPHGIKGNDLIEALLSINRHPKLCGLEISEFNPENDWNNKTLHLMEKIIFAFYGDTRLNKSLGSSNSGISGVSFPT